MISDIFYFVHSKYYEWFSFMIFLGLDHTQGMRTSPFAPADFEASSTMCTRCFETPELSRMHLHPQIQIPNAFPDTYSQFW